MYSFTSDCRKVDYLKLQKKDFNLICSKASPVNKNIMRAAEVSAVVASSREERGFGELELTVSPPRPPSGILNLGVDPNTPNKIKVHTDKNGTNEEDSLTRNTGLSIDTSNLRLCLMMHF